MANGLGWGGLGAAGAGTANALKDLIAQRAVEQRLETERLQQLISLAQAVPPDVDLDAATLDRMFGQSQARGLFQLGPTGYRRAMDPLDRQRMAAAQEAEAQARYRNLYSQGVASHYGLQLPGGGPPPGQAPMGGAPMMGGQPLRVAPMGGGGPAGGAMLPTGPPTMTPVPGKGRAATVSPGGVAIPFEATTLGRSMYAGLGQGANPFGHPQLVTHMDEQGNEVQEFATPIEGRIFRKAPTQAQREKGEALRAVMPSLTLLQKMSDEIHYSREELSGTLGMLAGPAIAAMGPIRTAAGAVNLNEKVAAYNALVNAIGPQVAKALGQVGQLAIQEVRWALQAIPSVNDTKELADRKIGALLFIAKYAPMMMNARTPEEEARIGRMMTEQAEKLYGISEFVQPTGTYTYKDPDTGDDAFIETSGPGWLAEQKPGGATETTPTPPGGAAAAPTPAAPAPAGGAPATPGTARERGRPEYDAGWRGYTQQGPATAEPEENPTDQPFPQATGSTLNDTPEVGPQRPPMTPGTPGPNPLGSPGAVQYGATGRDIELTPPTRPLRTVEGAEVLGPEADVARRAEEVAAAFRQVESGGDYRKRGASGEVGAYQFTRDTWNRYADEVLGNPQAPMTRANQDRVAIAKITEWLQQGFTVPEIASMWNAGEGSVSGPGGGFRAKRGVNRFGVPYDSARHVDRIIRALSRAGAGR